jgi:hypothetical protein
MPPGIARFRPRLLGGNIVVPRHNTTPEFNEKKRKS